MVTEIIKQEEVDPIYMDIADGILDGITDEAVAVCRDNWRRKYNRYCDWDEILNIQAKYNTKYIPLTKW